MSDLANLKPTIRLSIMNPDAESGSLFGRGIASLCLGVRETGSLNAAAKGMGMAYSKAWKILRRIESYMGFQLVFRQVGRGCGSSLTEKGIDLLNRYDAFMAEMNQTAGTCFHRHFDGL